jgi:hypothetical protein
VGVPDKSGLLPMGLHVLAKQLVDTCLIPRALGLEPSQNVSIQSDGHRLLGGNMQLGFAKEIIAQLWNVRCIDVLILLPDNSIRFGSRLRESQNWLHLLLTSRAGPLPIINATHPISLNFQRSRLSTAYTPTREKNG